MKTLKEIAQEQKATPPVEAPAAPEVVKAPTPPNPSVSTDAGPDRYFWTKCQQRHWNVVVTMLSGVRWVGVPKGFGRFWLRVEVDGEDLLINKSAIATIRRDLDSVKPEAPSV